MIIAIDGPAAAGKGTLARRIAAALSLPYLDTGLLYRAVGRLVLDAGQDPADEEAATKAARTITELDLRRTDLRDPKADRAASQVASIPSVRQALLDYQRHYGNQNGAVLDGRDIGTIVFPRADVKLFITASLAARAARRHAELTQRGEAVSLEAVLADMAARDEADRNRIAAPLKPAFDATAIDTTDIDAETAFQKALALIEEKSRHAPAATVSEALATRLSVRDFLADPVAEMTLRRVLEKAARAPSGGNLQPWHVVVLTGAPLASLVEKVTARQAKMPKGEAAEYPVYPNPISEPYAGRRFKIGEDMYALLGIAREDREARRAWFARNFRFFDAPVGLFCFVDRQMGAAQFSDLGMFLQSVMLLLREEGLDSCAQEAWSMFAPTIYAALGTRPEHMLFCGLAIGRRNPAAPVNSLVSERAKLEDFATFEGFTS
jgi:cytidylate kinase